jgi:hypothetical protein
MAADDEAQPRDDAAPSRPARARRPRRTPSVADTAATAPAIAEDGSAIVADRVDVRLGAVGRVDSTELSIHQGAVGAARAETISIEQGALGAALAADVSVRQGFARVIVARRVTVEQSFVRSLMAGEVRLERASGVGILLARRVVGDVRVLVDWRGALAFGAAAGLVAGLVGRGRRRPRARGDRKAG